MLAPNARVSAWFIPFALGLTVLTSPLTVRDPLITAPILVAATAFGAYTWWKERPRGFIGSFLAVQLGLLALLTAGMVALLFL